MPTRSEVQKEITGSADLIRRKYLKKLQAHTKRDTILYASAFTSKKVPNLPNYILSITVEDIQGFMSSLCGLSGKSLDLILHSPGGSLEAAEQVVQYLRSKYEHIRAIIPQNAMSAATMIACACDEICMGKQSAIGPIDPQVQVPIANGVFTVAAQSVLDDFERARQDVLTKIQLAPLWAAKMKDYPPGLLTTCERTIAVAIDRVSTWLAQYMFHGEMEAQAKA
jgi:ClpP class serine protease